MIIRVAVKTQWLLQPQSKHNAYYLRSQNTMIIRVAVKHNDYYSHSQNTMIKTPAVKNTMINTVAVTTQWLLQPQSKHNDY